MRQSFGGMSQLSFGPGPLTPGVKMLLLANVGVFVLTQLVTQIPWNTLFGLVPNKVLGELRVWQIATYLFLHANFWHLFMNMFALWMFGVTLERRWGSDYFLQYFFVTGIGAAIVTALFMWGQPTPTIGASGAIFAILVAFAVTFPNQPIMLGFLFPVPAKIFVLIFAGLELLSLRQNDSVNHVTHLAGAAIGFLFLRTDWRPTGAWKKFRRRMQRRHLRVVRPTPPRGKTVNEAEIDAILDKISREGIENLTDSEIRKLRDRSRH